MSEAPKLSLKRAENVALGGLIVQGALAIVIFLASAYGNSLAVLIEAWHLVLGVPLWLVVLLHQRLKRQAAEEELELDELAKLRQREGATRSATLFEEGHIDPYAARGRLERFERWAGILFSALLAAGLGGMGLLPYAGRVVGYDAKAANIGNSGEVAVILLGAAIVAFLLAKYAAGMATQQAWRPLRAGASYLMANCYLLILLALAQALMTFDILLADIVLAWIIPGFMTLIGVEMLLALVLDFYRPRLREQEHRPPYDSRLLQIATEGGGLLGTVSEALNYQFGFRVSDTWFYRFMEKAIAPLILFQAFAFWALSCVLIIGPGDVAFVERWGAVIRDDSGSPRPYDPGFHLKLPWPIDRARLCRASDVRTLSIGDPWKEEDGQRYRHVLWSVPHTTDPFIFLVASRETENRAIFLSGRIYVQYNVAYDPDSPDPERWRNPYDYLYSSVAGPDELLVRDDWREMPQRPTPRRPFDYETRMDRMVRNLSYREAVIYISGVDLTDFLTSDRHDAAIEIRRRIQEQADALRLGVTIIHVSLEEMHPPVTAFDTAGLDDEPQGVASSYERVAGAQFEKQSEIAQAQIRRRAIQADALAQSYGRVKRAEADSYRQVQTAQAMAERLITRHGIYRNVGSLYLQREYLRAIADAIGKSRKIVVPHWLNTHNVLVLNLEEVLQTLEGGLIQEGD